MNERDAAAHWDKLADDEDAKAIWDSSHGFGDVSANKARADLFRRTARSIRLEVSTGIPHCVCHVKPSKDCPTRKP